MLLTAKTTPNLWVYHPPQHNQRESSLRYQNGFIFFKPSSRTSFLSSHLDNSYTTINASASLIQTTKHKITDQNAEIHRFCEVGNLKMAMELLYKAEKSTLEIRTYCLILQLCADMKSLNSGREVHSIISSNDFQIDEMLGSKLVFMYVTCGDLGEGRRIFDKIANEKVFMWNLFINEYAKIGDFRESVYMYKKMLDLGVKPNSYTFSSVLKCFSALGSVAEGECVHGYLLKLGFGSYNTVVNSLIAFYFRCRRIESAFNLFDELTDRDVITWNSMISGYVSNGFSEKGLVFFKEMLILGIIVDLSTMVSVLGACSNIGSSLLGSALHAHAIKAGFDTEMIFSNTLLDMYAKCGNMDSAIQVFERMDNRSVVSWTSMICGYAREGQSDKAIEKFLEMRREGVKPDVFTITSVLHACSCSSSLENGREMHNYIRERNMKLSLFVSNALMDMYAKCGSMEDALAVFSQMSEKDIISWNTMIGGYSKNNLPNEALNLFVKMQQNLKPDNRTMTCILSACASLAAFDRGREIHSYILRNGFSSDRYVLNALVDMYVKCGVLVLAQLLFDMIPVKDLVSWTVMISGYGMHGFGSEAIATFHKMRNAGIEADEVSFIAILYACSHSGLLDEGWRFFNLMRNDFKIEPKLEHYACMVDLLSRAGKLSKAYKFIQTMPIEPDATIWGSLLCGCRIHHDVKLAEKVAERVFELEPENTGYYVLLANIYAEAEKWEEVKQLRERIGRYRLNKNPGCSWIEFKGEVHIFLAGDKSNPQAEKIESFLKKLRTNMKEEGLVPKLNYALIDADEMEKEVALCGHSEKLAMAFGILNSPRGKIIRVTKNLRVCGDCHEMAKFMSKIVEREIVLRDSNRFHHFKDGYCSCRGYW